MRLRDELDRPSKPPRDSEVEQEQRKQRRKLLTLTQQINPR